jgi:amino acid transporter
VLYTMAENNSMPSIFLQMNERLGTPGWGLFICFLIEVGFLLLSGGGYGALISSINVAFMVAYAMGPVANGGLRIIAPDTKRPYRVPLARVVNPLAFVLASLLLFWSRWPLTGETLGVLFIGVLIYIGYGVAGRVDLKTIRYGLWLITYLLVMALLSFLGDRHFGGIGVLPFGWDLLAVVVVCLMLYYWGVRQSVDFDRDTGSRAENDAVVRQEAVRRARHEGDR